jgi:hypothetical protein
MSKIPPQLRESVPALPESTTAFAFRHFFWALSACLLEDSFAGCQHFVERFLKVSRAFSKRLADLRNILFEALFYLLSKELFERTIPKTLGVFGRMVGDDVGDERACEALRPLIRILGEKRIHRASRTNS